MNVRGSSPAAGITAGATVAIAVVQVAMRPLACMLISGMAPDTPQLGTKAWTTERTMTSTSAIKFRTGASSLGICAINCISGSTNPGAIGCNTDGSWATALTKD